MGGQVLLCHVDISGSTASILMLSMSQIMLLFNNKDDINVSILNYLSSDRRLMTSTLLLLLRFIRSLSVSKRERL